MCGVNLIFGCGCGFPKARSAGYGFADAGVCAVNRILGYDLGHFVGLNKPSSLLFQNYFSVV